jgi:hypothetical protein
MTKRHEDDGEDSLTRPPLNWSVGGWVPPAFWLAVVVLAAIFVWFWR